MPIGALLAALVMASPASAGGFYQGPITGVSGSCLDDWGGNVYPGSPVDAYAKCNGTNAQQWVYIGGTLEQQASLFKGGTVYCLDVNGGSRSPGAHVQIWPCNGGQSQQWVQLPGGALHTPNAGSNLCLDVPGNQVTPVGARSPIQLQIWTCNGGPNQNWSSIG